MKKRKCVGVFPVSVFLFSLVQPMAFAVPVTASQAVEKAQQFADETQLKVAPGVKAAAKGKPAPFKGPDGKTLAYVVELGEKGFVIVAGDTDVDPILYFSTDQRCSGLMDARNPLRALLLCDVPQRLDIAAKHPDVRKSISEKWAPPSKRAPIDPDLLTIYSGPFMDTLWNQNDEFMTGSVKNYTYNLYTPNHYPAGCVAVALGQVLKWFQYPLSASGEEDIEVDGHDWDDQSFNDTYDYDQMPNELGSSSGAASIQQVARLLYSAGITVEMEYTGSGSSSDTADTADVLKDVYGYTSAEWSSSNLQTKRQLLYNELWNWKFPAILAIRDTTDGGHAIVADGYAIYSGQEVYHFNFGWGGDDNGWYVLPTFATIQNIHTWNVFRGVVTYIRPPVRRGVDMLIGAEAVSPWYNGGNIYNDSGNNQSAFDLASSTYAARYELRLHNDGSYPDYLKVQCPAGFPDWTERFYDSNRVEITSAVMSSGFVSELIRPGQDLVVFLDLTPSNSVPVGTVTGLLVRGYSNSDLSRRDSVMASVRVESSRPNLMVRPAGATHAYSNRVAASVLTAEQTNRYEVVIRNDGDGAEAFYPTVARANLYYIAPIFGGSADTFSLTNWNVVWRDYYGRDITVLMDCGFWWTPTLQPGATQYYTVSISPGRVVDGGHRMRLTTRARTADRSVTDSVAIDVAKAWYSPELWLGSDWSSVGQVDVAKLAATNYSATYYLKLLNAGEATDRLTLRAAVSGVPAGSWQVTFESEDGPYDITSAVLGSGWSTDLVLIRDERIVNLSLRPTAAAPVGQTCVVTCAVSSWGDIWVTNTLRALASRGVPGVQVQSAVPGGAWQDYTASQRIPTMNTTSFNVRIANRGAFTDTFDLTVDETDCTGWTIYYYDSISNNITFMLYATNFATQALAADGGYEDIRVDMQPDSGLTNGATGVLRIKARSRNDGAVSGSVCVAGVRMEYRPELFARPEADPIYRQTEARAACAQNRDAVYFVQARNQGEASDSLTLQGVFSAATGTTNWEVRYFSDPEGLTNITEYVAAGGWSPGYIDPESSTDLRVEVWASNSVPGDSEGRIDLTAYSGSSSLSTSHIALITTKAPTVYNPVVLVRNAEGGAYGTAIASQRVAAATASFDFLVRNDGDDDSFMLTNQIVFTEWGVWTVRYLDASGDDVTAELVDGQWYTFTNGQVRSFRVEVTPSNDVPPDALCQVVLEARSQGDPAWFTDGIGLVSKASCGVELKVWNTYWGAYTNEARDALALPNNPGIYYWEVCNTGEIPDYINLFSYHSSDDYWGWKVRHFNNSTGGDDISEWMTADGGLKIGPLTPGMTYYFRTEACPEASVLSNSYCGIYMRAEADGYWGSMKAITASNILREVGQVETLIDLPEIYAFNSNMATQYVETGSNATFLLLLRNRSAAHDSFKLSADSSWGGGNPANWSIRAYNAQTGGDDVTDLLNAGELIYGPIAHDNGAFLRLECEPLGTAAEDEVLTVQLGVSSLGENGVGGSAYAENHMLGLLRIKSAARDGGAQEITFEWASAPGAWYNVEATDDLNSDVYTPVMYDIYAVSNRASAAIAIPVNTQMFYRILKQ